jgi:aconitase A
MMREVDADSYCTGGLGMVAIGVGGADAVDVMSDKLGIKVSTN